MTYSSSQLYFIETDPENICMQNSSMYHSFHHNDTPYPSPSPARSPFLSSFSNLNISKMAAGGHRRLEISDFLLSVSTFNSHQSIPALNDTYSVDIQCKIAVLSPKQAAGRENK